MNEMKPKDVMMALECCDKGSECFCDCDSCPYYGCDFPCKDKLHKDALALIREKDAEISKVKTKTIEDFLAKAKPAIREIGALKPFVTYEDLILIAQKLKEENK